MVTAEALEPYQEAWLEQRRLIFGEVCEGPWWGTITSEPGASGDLTRSKLRRGLRCRGGENGHARSVLSAMGRTADTSASRSNIQDRYARPDKVFFSGTARHLPGRRGLHPPLRNICGTTAISVPLNWNTDRLHIGSQFAARMGAEAALLALAYELEEARPWVRKAAFVRHVKPDATRVEGVGMAF
jgi:hypothetical protein